MLDTNKSGWTATVERIVGGDQSAEDELFARIGPGIRYLAYRQLGADAADDVKQEVFLMLIDQIRTGTLKDPDKLSSYAYTILRRAIAAEIRRRSQKRAYESSIEATACTLFDGSPDAEQLASRRETSEITRIVLAGMSGLEREVLTRAYVHGQDRETICRDLNLSFTQFRLKKNRAKAKFGMLAKQRILRSLPRAASFAEEDAGGSPDRTALCPA